LVGFVNQKASIFLALSGGRSDLLCHQQPDVRFAAQKIMSAVVNKHVSWVMTSQAAVGVRSEQGIWPMRYTLLIHFFVDFVHLACACLVVMRNYFSVIEKAHSEAVEAVNLILPSYFSCFFSFFFIN